MVLRSNGFFKNPETLDLSMRSDEMGPYKPSHLFYLLSAPPDRAREFPWRRATNES